MRTKHLPLYAVMVIFLASCSTAYRTGQTPDDVYYSPEPAAAEGYVVSDNRDNRESYASRNSDYNEDLAIRRGIRNPSYRSNVYVSFGAGVPYGMGYYDPYGFNNYGYYNASRFNNFGYYNPYSFNSPYAYNSYYDPFFNPYYGGIGLSPYQGYNYYPQSYISLKNPVSTNISRGARVYNLRPYNANNNRSNTRVVGNTYRPSNSNSTQVRRTNTTPAPSNDNRSVGNRIRRVFTPSDNSGRSNRVSPSENSRSYDNSTYSPSRSSSSSSSSSSNSSSGSSSAPTRTFRK